MAHPTRFERVTFAFGGQSLRYQWRRNAFDQSQESDVASPATTPQGASLRRVTLPCESAPWSFMPSTADKFKGWARILMSYDRHPRKAGRRSGLSDATIA